MKYRFTVFTPCYNSEKFIHRVYESLKSQIFKDFEWLVINDASSDKTLNLIEVFKEKAEFPVRIVNNEKNMMLYYNFNIAFEEAEGEFMVFAGHDDRFDSNALEIFDQTWKEYGDESIARIIAKCRDQNGNQIGTSFPQNVVIGNYFKMYVNYIYGNQERFGCTRTDILRKYPFNLKSGRIGETFLWEQIGLKYNTIFIDKILRTYYREKNNPNALTKRTRSQTGISLYLHYLDWINNYLKLINGYYLFKLRFNFALCFYAAINKIKISKTLKEINTIQNKLLYIFLFIPAHIVKYYLSKTNQL